MKLERSLTFGASIGSAFTLLPWLYIFWSPSFSRESSEWANFGTFLGGVLSPALAFAALVGLVMTIKQQGDAAKREGEVTDNESYFKHAVSSLERAFATLSPSDAAQPAHDRLAWLSCARLLLAASDASQKITTASSGLKQLYESEAEHWRHQFYLLLLPATLQGVGGDSNYFAADSSGFHMPIDERSIRVIYDFAHWSEGREDPIDGVPRYTEEELDGMKFGMRGIRQYVQSKHPF
jgi:hypothetical protein